MFKQTPRHMSLCFVILHYYRAYLWLVSLSTVCQGDIKAVKHSHFKIISDKGSIQLCYKTSLFS